MGLLCGSSQSHEALDLKSSQLDVKSAAPSFLQVHLFPKVGELMLLCLISKYIAVHLQLHCPCLCSRLDQLTFRDSHILICQVSQEKMRVAQLLCQHICIEQVYVAPMPPPV